MDVVAALVADAEAAVLVEPADRALDHPALLFRSPGRVCSWARRSSPGTAAQRAPTLA